MGRMSWSNIEPLFRSIGCIDEHHWGCVQCLQKMALESTGIPTSMSRVTGCVRFDPLPCVLCCCRSTEVTTVEPVMTVGALYDIVTGTDHANFPVVRKKDSRLQGVMARKRLGVLYSLKVSSLQIDGFAFQDRIFLFSKGCALLHQGISRSAPRL